MTGAMSAETALCTSCGLCCTGALHDLAALDQDELAPAAALGLPVRAASLPHGFALPCPRLDGTSCTIYASRPRVCAAYACQLLEDVRGGRDLASALPVVAEARRLASELHAVLPPGANLPAARAMLTAGTSPAATRLLTFALDTYLDRHFRNGREGPILKSESC